MSECATIQGCPKQADLDELFRRTNQHESRLAVIEVKMNLILWGIGVVAILVIGGIYTTITQSKERVDRLYYQSIQQGEKFSPAK